ncbi:DUF2474 domain-containing protein [Methylobacillus sp. Pita2]|nr:DUF2474 domain-containing protein [Methylobacillus flagellatus]MDR5171032.1 DUF2474 domain-containing protein [Methylobacillus flagellatus]
MATTDQDKARPAWIKRLLWLALIWAASVTAMLAAAFLMRLFMQAIGLHS